MSATPAHVWPLLAALLALSATFSASETALFSLSAQERGKVSAGARSLLERPRRLLITILLGNLVVNVLYFTFATRVRFDVGEHEQLLVGLGALLTLLVLGEILPKTLALRARIPMSMPAAALMGPLVKLLAPVRVAVQACLDLALRALGESGRDEHGVTPELLAGVLTKSAQEGLLEGSEANMLVEIVELGSVRVREIMTPRVDALLLDVDQDPQPVLDEALKRLTTWLPVIEGTPDRVIGCVGVRELLRAGGRPLRQLVMPVKFVPEVASVLDLLRELREDRAAEAVVVDEWGGTAGVVTVEDVFEEIVGDLLVEGEAREKPVVPLGEGRFRVAGGLSIREWNEQFGYRVVPTEFETVGGFVTALLGRIPRAGDVVRVGDIVCEVHAVRGRRVVDIDLYVEEKSGRGAS